MLEHGAYNLLLDACYDRERFPTLEEAIDWCWARTDEEVAAVKFVLSKFFEPREGVHIQKRVAEEIAEFQEYCALQAEKGKLGGRPKKPGGFPEKPDGLNNKPSGNPAESNCKAGESLTHNPLTTNQEPNKTISAELQDSSPPFISLTLNDKSEFPITEDQIAEWQGLYPAADVRQELRNMRGWLIANPQKRKTKRGILNFVTSWLSRTQDRGSTNGRQPHQQTPAKLPARERVSQALDKWAAEQSRGDFIDGESVAVDDGNVR